MSRGTALLACSRQLSSACSEIFPRLLDISLGLPSPSHCEDRDREARQVEQERARRPSSMAGEAKKLFAASEVALHAFRKDCWVVIGGKVSEEEIFLVVLSPGSLGGDEPDRDPIRFGLTLMILLGLAWMVGLFQVYDVTKFLEDHPGGEDVLLHASGRPRLCSLSLLQFPVCFSFLQVYLFTLCTESFC